MFVIHTVAVISNVCVVTVNKWPNNVPFSAVIQFFFRVTLNVLVRTPGGTRTPGWESLIYSIDI
jgi:hypothetical protein